MCGKPPSRKPPVGPSGGRSAMVGPVRSRTACAEPCAIEFIDSDGGFCAAVLAICLLLCLRVPMLAQGSPAQPGADQPYTIEYYYKCQWGHQAEFLRLFLKNHYPLLKKIESTGRIVRQNRAAGLPHFRRVALGLSRDDCLQELDAGDDGKSGRRGDDQGALAGPGDLQERGTAAVRDFAWAY
jgi:hypothetical protein